MRTCAIYLLMPLMLLLSSPVMSSADEPAYPDYMVKAQSLVERASSQASELGSFTDEVLIARNFIRNAEAEYKKNLGWTGKFDAKAEPTVRYFANMAQTQAAIVLSRAGKISQEKALAAYEANAANVKASIKVFDDKNAEIATLKAALEEGGKRQAASVEKIAELTKSLELSRADNARLKQEVTALTAAKGAEASQSQEQIRALNRQKDFIAEVGKLGGMIKAGSDNMTVIYPRASIFKAPRNDRLAPEGVRMVGRVIDLQKKYPEYRIKVRVHGFGSPTRSEDAAATDRMARLIRNSMLDKGRLAAADVDVLGVGVAEPIYPKSNKEGNRRVEVTFVKK